MHRLLDNFEKFLHAPSNLPPLLRLGLIHYQFEAIHPFLDGNGRVGRLPLSLLLCVWGLLSQPLLYLSAYFEASRPVYYEHLLVLSRRGTWEEWLIYFLLGVRDQSWDAIARIRHLHDLREGYRVRLQMAGATSKLLTIIDLLFAHPIITVQQIGDAAEVTYATANRYATQLEEAGIIREITGQARNRIYRAGEIMEAIEGPTTPPRSALPPQPTTES